MCEASSPKWILFNLIPKQEITRGIDNYCVPQLAELTSKAQDILNGEKESDAKKNTEITEAITRLSNNIEDLRHYTESQKVQ